jgi:ankyrin repeat protein
VDLRTNTGFSALHYTAFWGHTAVVRALLTGGASVMLQTANGGGRGCTELLVDAGSNALHLCAENGHVMVAATLLMAHVSMVGLMLACAADVGVCCCVLLGG